MMPHYIGIDPGASGGVVVLDKASRIVLKTPMPDLPKLCHLLEGNWPTHVFLEQVASRPGQGVSSVFKFGCHYGSLMGVLTALGIAHTLVRPQTWMKQMHMGTSGTDTKDRSAQAARRLWPKEDWRASERCKKDHDGMQEAALVCLYGIRLLNGKESNE